MSTAAVINLIQHVRRQEGHPEGSGAAIPKLEGHGAEPSGELLIPSPTLPCLANGPLLLSPESQTSVLRTTSLMEVWVR